MLQWYYKQCSVSRTCFLKLICRYSCSSILFNFNCFKRLYFIISKAVPVMFSLLKKFLAYFFFFLVHMNFRISMPSYPGSAVVKICMQCRRYKRCRFNPWVGEMPWNREWQPVSVFLSGKFHGQKSLWGTIAHGTTKSQTQQSIAQSRQLVTHTHTHTHKYKLIGILKLKLPWIYRLIWGNNLYLCNTWCSHSSCMVWLVKSVIFSCKVF